MNGTVHTRFKKRAVALAVASCLSISPWIAEAAGLGKLTVLSGIGQPLRAELDIGATREELGGMSARLAPQDVFKQAGVDFASVLLDLRFAVEKRPGGQSIVKVSSVKPINEPFLDFLVELNWPAGRLVREYTFLLDPPEMRAAQSSRSVADARIVETVRGGGSAGESRPAPLRTAPRNAPESKVASEPGRRMESPGVHVVKSGETLRQIASENKYDGVSLEQMLIGLFQSNPDAFVAENVNRLKAGAILNVPEQSAVESVSPAEARKIYVAHARDWNAYRQKLAASTAKTPAADGVATQTSTGKITAKVDEKIAPEEQSKDQVKVARTDPAAKGAAAGKAAEAADQVAKDKALKDAQDRLQALEKNVNELQKLLELKNQKLAELQQPPVMKDEPKVAEVTKPVEPSKSAETAKAPEPKPAEVASPVESPKVPDAAKPVEPPKPAEEAKPVVPPTVAPPMEQVQDEPSFVDSLLEDPLPLVGGGGVLALLAGYFLYSRRRTRSSSVETTALPMPSSLGPNSVFRMTGGQSIDTGNTPPQTGEFSQTGPGTIDTDEVDPVAEADVYMAYGRDTQAEEILLEALQKDPQRTAIHAKLLEIYANRHSVKQFETLAGELYAQTAGVGPDWAKVAVLGLELDPNNPLYSASQAQAAPEVVDGSLLELADAPADLQAEVPVEVAESLATFPEPEPGSGSDIEPEAEDAPVALDLSEGFEHDTLVLPKEPEVEIVDDAAGETLDFGSDAMTLDFDLGEETVAPEIVSQSAAEAEPYTDTVVSVSDTDALDFDLGGELAPVVEESAVPDVLTNEEDADSANEDLDLSAAEGALGEEPAAPAPDFSPDGTLVMPSAVAEMAEDIDVGLGTWVGGEEVSDELHAESLPEDVPPASALGNDEDKALTQTVVNHLSGTDTLIDSNILNFGGDEHNDKLDQTVVNSAVVDSDSLEFDVKLTDSMFLGQPMGAQEFDIGSINLDLSTPPEAAPDALADVGVAPVEATALDAPSVEAPVEEEAPVHNEHWEEVNTKLDLAKAYEEMGDLEGARELLQEVVGEGSVDLVEQARTILGRIGG
ncbi:MAG: pilus assembly protein [Gammaproteobacteria bacterium]|nr:pilus assembly protein [Gammaproteobacteria bacterium]MBU1603464.1 pilus assembly protein [Gammaproteobacteria bacterium]MBU2432984.1 pilus assembly protein [Gammaproteobacteria bacterium]MBU2450227.1 pilus assembly protein [Gammaproteobacteria bacterium]